LGLDAEGPAGTNQCVDTLHRRQVFRLAEGEPV
jgi:hypothetical protein